MKRIPLIITVIAVVFVLRLDLHAQSNGPKQVKLAIQRLTVAALCNEKGFSKGDSLDLDAYPGDYAALCEQYRSCKEIPASKGNVLKDYFDAIDSIFDSNNSTIPNLNKYKESLLDSLKKGKREEKTIQNLEFQYDLLIHRYESVLDDAKSQVKVEEANSIPTAAPNQEAFDPLWIWIFLGIVGLLVLVILFLVYQLHKGLIDQGSKRKALEETVKQLSNEIAGLKSALGNQESSVQALSREKEQLDARLKGLAEKQSKGEGGVGHSPSAPVSVQPVAPPPPPPPKKRYAIYADEGHGFSASSLKESPTSETIFEITLLSDTTAEFKVSESQAAQELAKTDIRQYMATTCEYSNASTSAFIRTTRSGKLKLQGNTWVIDAKAVVSFEQ